jgi:hypothetical protein
MLRALAPLPLLIIIGMTVAGWTAAVWLRRPSSLPKPRSARDTALGQPPFAWQKGTLYLLGLLVLLIIVYKGRESVSLAMNQTLLAAPASSLTNLVVQAGGHGVLTLLCYAYAGLLIWQAGRTHGPMQSRRGLALTLVSLLGASLIFLASSTGHILWNTGAALDDISGAQYAAEMSYQGAEQLLPWALELRIEHLRFLQTPVGTSLGIDTVPLEQALYTLDPFFDNQVTRLPE